MISAMWMSDADVYELEMLCCTDIRQLYQYQ